MTKTWLIVREKKTEVRKGGRDRVPARMVEMYRAGGTALGSERGRIHLHLGREKEKTIDNH